MFIKFLFPAFGHPIYFCPFLLFHFFSPFFALDFKSVKALIAARETAEKKRRLFTKSLARRASGRKENNPSSARTRLLLITAFLCTCERAVPHRAITSARHLINVPSKEWFPIARNLLALDRRLHSALRPRLP